MTAEDQINILKHLEAIEFHNKSAKITTLISPIDGFTTIVGYVKDMKLRLSMIEDILSKPIPENKSYKMTLISLQGFLQKDF